MSEHTDNWPNYERFPYNYIDSQVEVVIDADLNYSKNPLIITGYASLDKIIDFLDKNYDRFSKNAESFNSIRILLGNEPYPTNKQEFSSSKQFSEEIVEYWLEQGISILKCYKVIAAIELLRSGKVYARIANKKLIHAKIYKGDNAITIGSSNFSNLGLKFQIEGNVRFRKQKEPERFDEACLLAERIWELGRDYKDELIKLLEQLLHKVDWREALARACVELLEGEWAKKYQTTSYFNDELQLWPSQEKGIAQAIWVIENVGSVLIADATGSGKTHMGSYLIKCLMNQIWKTGRKRRGIPVLICPPAVKNAWESEFTTCNHSLKTVSHGKLSNPNSDEDISSEDIDIRAIHRAQVLAVDEAHNFLNRGSNRTKAIFRNIADYVLLFTATPINKSSRDLLGIIELLGADNFDDGLLEYLKPIWNNRGKLNEKMSPNLRETLRDAIQQFTVRRTKTILNRMIDEEPERYKDRFGKQCRYPEHLSKSFTCGETDSDRAIAQQIRDETQKLLGLMYLTKIPQLPEYLRNQGRTEENFIEWQLKRAKLQAAYMIMVCLRSSRAALLEHIYGTEYAKKLFKLLGQVKKEDTGNSIKKLQDIAGKLPKNNLEIELPDWLGDSSKHKQACNEEINIYKNIANLCENQMSDSRQETKARQIIRLLDNHKLVIAFDSSLISLHDIKHHLEKYQRGKVIIATGNDNKERERINQMFQLGSQESGIIALCSDAMSEGVNLQQASAVIQLTMPSVMRLAEQRIGRIDRMDSPHSTIEVLWPKDSNEFALRSSESKFLARHNLVSNLLRSNLPLPEDFSPEEDTNSSDDVVTSEADLANLKNKMQDSESPEWKDVFDPVRSLIEGARPLVSREKYNEIRTSQARTNSCFSFVQAETHEAWAFFAIAGTEWGAPRWVYLDDENNNPITDLDKISKKLREKNLFSRDEYSDRETAIIHLEKFLKAVIRHEKMLLPQKKQRAIDEMEFIIEKYKIKAVKEKNNDREILCNKIIDLFKEVELGQQRVDLSLLAEWWIDLIRPHWFERLKEHRRSKPLRLQDIRNDLIQNPISTKDLNEVFKLPKVKPLDERIVAAIIGMW